MNNTRVEPEKMKFDKIFFNKDIVVTVTDSAIYRNIGDEDCELFGKEKQGLCPKLHSIS
jgi:hypothetical protein